MSKFLENLTPIDLNSEERPKEKNQKLLTTEHLSLSVMDFSVQKYLDQLETMSVFVVNIKRCVIKVLCVRNVVLK